MEGRDYRSPLNFKSAARQTTSSSSDLDKMHTRSSTLTGVQRAAEAITPSHPRPLPTPTRSMVSPLQNLLPSAPASPPTPAPSPTPQLHRLPTWSTANENEDTFLRDARPHFSRLDPQERQRFLAEILNLCDSQQLSFVLNYVSPRLKKDPFKSLPNELCLRVWPPVCTQVCMSR
jgi:F-box and WD-40 domain protein CDC4